MPLGNPYSIQDARNLLYLGIDVEDALALAENTEI